MDMVLQNKKIDNDLPLASYLYDMHLYDMDTCLQITFLYELCTSCFTLEWFIACVDTDMGL